LITEQASPRLWSRNLILLALLFGAFYAFRLGSYPLANPDEGRNAEIPREMVASGNWVTPRLNGVNYFEKPPLMYWTVAAGMEVFGANEWVVRAAPVIFALAGILFTYAAARRIYGHAAGLAAATVLGTSLLYFALARFLILDMAVSVLMSATLFCFILGIREPPPASGAGIWTAHRRCWFYGLYASAALATLAKGLMGFLVTGAVMFLWLLIFKQWKRLRPFYLPTGALLFLAIAAPWHLLVAAHNPTWFHRYVVFEHVERFLTPAASRAGPWWYFIPIVLLGLFPWSGFLWAGMRSAVRGGWSERNKNADTWFFVIWAGFIFLFFSASHSKLPPYILPVFPALAVVIGRWLALSLPEGGLRLRGGLAFFSFFCGLLAAALCVVVLRPSLVHNFSAAQALALQPAAFSLSAILVLGGILAPALARTGRARASLGTMAATIVLFGGILTFAAANIQRPGTKDLALFVQAHAGPSDRVVHYHEFFHDFPFYAGRLVDVVEFKGELELEEDAAARASGRFLDETAFRELWRQPGRVFAVARKKDTSGLFADPTFTYHLLAQSEDHYLFSNQP
jgi:4-amino-4-deoxy-L-arabinose transferase-like glycosyltransferase